MLSILWSLINQQNITIPIEPRKILLTTLNSETQEKIRKLGSSYYVRVVDAGSANDVEHEIAALENPIYDLSRFGIRIVASPRHADILLVTGPVTEKMKPALLDCYRASPQPLLVVAVGDGAITGNVVDGFSDDSLSKVSDVVPVDWSIPGDPPSPQIILEDLISLINACK